MITKVPVGRTISSGYNFLFTRFLSVLGIVWLPYLVFIVITVGLVRLLAPEVLQMLITHDVDAPGLMALARISGLIGILGFIVGAMVTVGLQRKALGKDPRPAYVYFSLAAPVWRMAAALFLADIVLIIIASLVIAACIAIWFAAGALGAGTWLVRAVAIIVGLAFFIYVAVRLLFFLPAVVVAEESLGFERAWTLSSRNFWRAFIVIIAVVLPIAIAFHILSWGIIGSQVSVLGLYGQMSAREILRTVLLQIGTIGPLLIAVELLERIVLLAVLNGAVASAYLAVTGSAAQPAAPVASAT